MFAAKHWRFLWESGRCVAILGGLGLVFLCCGGNGIVENQTPPAVTSVTVAELEATTKLPEDGQWLDLSDGYLCWDAALESITTTHRLIQPGGPTTTVNAVYIPLVSKGIYDSWRAFVANGGDVAFLPYEKCRVVVKYPNMAAAMSHKLPLHPRPEPRFALQGVARRLDKEPTFVTKQTKDNHAAFRFDVRHTLVVDDDGTDPVTKTEVNRILSYCIVAIGLLLGLPLGVWMFRRLLIRRTANKPPVLPNEEPAPNT